MTCGRVLDATLGSRGLALAGLALVLASGASASGARAELTTLTFPLRVHADQRRSDWIAEQVVEANVRFAGAHLAFVVTESIGPLPRADDLELQSYAWFAVAADDRTAIDVFVVDATATSLAASGCTVGCALPPHVTPAASGFVALRSDAHTITLAHELGHFFGLRHRPESGNLMFSSPGLDGFDDRQLHDLRIAAEGFSIERRPPTIAP